MTWKKVISRPSVLVSALLKGVTWRTVGAIVLGAMLCSFGIYNIHRRVDITEGGILGLMLLVEHWFGISPALITPVLDGLCYLLAFRFLGGQFIKMSVLSTLCVSAFFRLWELFPPLLPNLSAYPLLAAVAGGLFVGIGVGLIVRQGGSCGGDDALALTIAHVTRWRLSRAYLFTDLTVLALSLSYIPVRRIVYSLVTVLVSSLLIDRVESFRLPFAKNALAQTKAGGRR